MRRDKVLARDGYACVFCGCRDVKTLTMDHLIPKKRGGSGEMSNLATACRTCNLQKGCRIYFGAFFNTHVAELYKMGLKRWLYGKTGKFQEDPELLAILLSDESEDPEEFEQAS